MTFKEFLGDIASAIREMSGEIGKIKPSDFGEKIRGIGEAIKPTLFTPIIDIDKYGVITITDENGGFAPAYEIYVNGNYIATVTEKTANLLDYIEIDDEVEVKVCAVENEHFNNSGFAVEYYENLLGTEGLQYELSSDGTYYTCTGIGTATEEEKIVIASYVGEIPVTKIKREAFNYCTNIKALTIPKTITAIGSYAFQGCSNVTKLLFKANVYDFVEYDDVFRGFGSNGTGVTVVIGKEVVHTPIRMFDVRMGYVKPKITEIVFEDNSICEDIRKYWIHSNDSTSLVIRNVPKTIKSIGEGSLNYCNADIYYNGTCDEWGLISGLSEAFNTSSSYKVTIHCTDGDIIVGS